MLCLTCVPSVIISFPFLSEPLLSSPNLFLSLPHPHYFSASPCSSVLFWHKHFVLSLFTYFSFLIRSILLFSVCFIHSRGGRKEDTEAQTQQVQQWCTSTYKSYSEIQYVNLLHYAHSCSSHFVLYFYFYLFFQQWASSPLDVSFHVSSFWENCPSVASWEGRKQQGSFGPSCALDTAELKVCSLWGEKTDERTVKRRSKELTQKLSVLELVDESANET